MMPQDPRSTIGTWSPLASSLMGCTTRPSGKGHLARRALLFGIACTVSRMLSREQLVGWLGSAGFSAAAFCSPVGRGSAARSMPCGSGPRPPPMLRASNFSVSGCASYGLYPPACGGRIGGPGGISGPGGGGGIKLFMGGGGGILMPGLMGPGGGGGVMPVLNGGAGMPGIDARASHGPGAGGPPNGGGGAIPPGKGGGGGISPLLGAGTGIPGRTGGGGPNAGGCNGAVPRGEGGRGGGVLPGGEVNVPEWEADLA
mmetsp:Transcript_7134/g.19175  ORF Transcript_7134/g.19175 Transcript_7134/m.19175 type:complete len:257 (-) Transcript_7134:1798-2568(-)